MMIMLRSHRGPVVSNVFFGPRIVKTLCAFVGHWRLTKSISGSTITNYCVYLSFYFRYVLSGLLSIRLPSVYFLITIHPCVTDV
jgi:hypothetical protein